MGPDEAGGDGGAAGADANAASSGGVVGGIRAVGKHLGQHHAGGRGEGEREDVEEEEEPTGDEEIGKASPGQTLERGSCWWWWWWVYYEGDGDEEEEEGGRRWCGRDGIPPRRRARGLPPALREISRVLAASLGESVRPSARMNRGARSRRREWRRGGRAARRGE